MTNHTKLFYLLTVFIAISDILFVWINYRAANNELNSYLEHTDQAIYANFKQSLANTEIQMLQLATFAAEDPRIQQLFLAGKKAVEKEGGGRGGEKSAAARAKLYELTGPSRDKLAATFDFRQLHFQLGPGAFSFLRVHRPEKFGDRMDTIRHTIVTVNETQYPVSGFESGRVYSGIRGVVPVHAIDPLTKKQTYVGALEAGTSFQMTLDTVAASQQAHLATLVTIGHLRNNVWPDFLEKTLQKSPAIHELVVESTSSPFITRILHTLSGKQINSNGRYQLVIDGSTYDIAVFSLRDFQGTRDSSRYDVGKTVIWRDITKEINSFQDTLRTNLFYALFGFCLIETLLFMGIRLSSRKLEYLIEEEGNKLQQSLEELHKHKLLLEQSQTIAHIGSWHLDLKTNILVWSDEVYRIFSLDPDNFTPTLGSFLTAVHPKDRDRVENAYSKSVKNGSTYEVIHRIILPDGKIRTILEKAEHISDKEGKTVHSYGIIQDITKQVTTEDTLREAQENAESANRTKSAFLASMSHELRTPLNGILGYATILQQDKEASKQQKQGLQIIHQCGQHLLMIINDILDISKIESGKLDLHLAEIHLQPFLQSIIALHRPQAEEKGLHFSLNLGLAQPATIIGDEIRLRQILFNLLGNSIKFTSHGSITIQINTVGQEQQDDNDKLLYTLQFSIEDSGSGIASDQQQNIFTPFHQAGDNLTKVQGTGLGLAISSKLVKKMGGRLSLISPLHTTPYGPGSRFSFTLDFLGSAKATNSGDKEQIPPKAYKNIRRSGENFTIMVVDDDIHSRTILVNLLAPLNFNIIEAENGTEALAITKKEQPDLIFMDLLMPDMDGFTAAEKIQANPKLDHIPLIAVSALLTEDAQQKALEAGCSTFIGKPYSMLSIYNVLEKNLPLSWIYGRTSAIASTTLTIPPLAEIELLIQFIKKGDVTATEQHVENLATQTPALQPFCDQVLKFSSAFKLDNLELYLNKSLQEAE